LAAHGQPVTLRVRVSRWRCQNARCETAIFAERLPGVATPRVRRTERFGVVAHVVGHAVGGRAGERLLRRLSMVISADTIVRLVKRGAPPASADETVRVVGIDDWAWQKGQRHFGTILVDLERRRVVDVIAVRTADAVAAWLVGHPNIRIISRDRHGPYADGVRRGAPQAREVADRFHLVSNLRAVQQELSRLRRFLVELFPRTFCTLPRELSSRRLGRFLIVHRPQGVEPREETADDRLHADYGPPATALRPPPSRSRPTHQGRDRRHGPRSPSLDGAWLAGRRTDGRRLS
jgi:Transposase